MQEETLHKTPLNANDERDSELTKWVEIPPTQRRCGLKPHVRFADSSKSSVDCGFCLCRFVPRAAQILPSILCRSICGSYIGAIRTAPVTLLAENKKDGRGWDAWWSDGCVDDHGLGRLRGGRSCHDGDSFNFEMAAYDLVEAEECLGYAWWTL